MTVAPLGLSYSWPSEELGAPLHSPIYDSHPHQHSDPSSCRSNDVVLRVASISKLCPADPRTAGAARAAVSNSAFVQQSAEGSSTPMETSSIRATTIPKRSVRPSYDSRLEAATSCPFRYGRAVAAVF